MLCKGLVDSCGSLVQGVKIRKLWKMINDDRCLRDVLFLYLQYDGDITSQTVKDRVIELMYTWYRGLPHENKIAEAYRMLKQQGRTASSSFIIFYCSHLSSFITLLL